MPAIHTYPTTQVVVLNTAPTLIRGANKARSSVLIVNLTGAQLVYISGQQGVSSSNGLPLAASVGSNVTFYSQDEIWGISAVASQTVSVWEEYTDK